MIAYSLFDGSGIMLKAYADAGWQCFAFNADAADHGEYPMRVEHENITYVNTWILEGWQPPEGIPSPDIIFSFPSCTYLAQSGSQHERDPELVKRDVGSARVAESLGEQFGCPWMVENPRGRLSTEWRPANHYFDPWQYGGHLSPDEGSYHPKMPLCDGYTKKTGIWCGNGFSMPDKRPGPFNVGYFWGWKYLGGNSARTKQLRSLTPRGFAKSVFEANNGKH